MEGAANRHLASRKWSVQKPSRQHKGLIGQSATHHSLLCLIYPSVSSDANKGIIVPMILTDDENVVMSYSSV